MNATPPPLSEQPGRTAPPAARPPAARPLALVTGARRGIGAAIAIELAARGFDLALTDLSADGAASTLRAIESHGARALLVESDLADQAAHAALVEQVVAWGGAIACLVNNAGIPAPQRGDLLDLTPAAFDRVLGVNLRGTFFLTQAVARHMVAEAAPAGSGAPLGPAAQPGPGGASAPGTVPVRATAATRSIITVSSVSAELASIERGEYCISKAGLGMVTRLFALRLAPHGIGVFEVRPGVIRTPMTEGVAATYDQRIAAGLVPAQRWGEPVDIARSVAALAGGDFAFATGSVLNVDGALAVPRL
jgi:NAD(P)-dependent dehydrogenase (short-subunit alcohol dehydrogenase family)